MTKKQLELALDLACLEITEMTGSCPFDFYDKDPWDGCDAGCGEDIVATCWKKHFQNRAKRR